MRIRSEFDESSTRVSILIAIIVTIRITDSRRVQ